MIRRVFGSGRLAVLGLLVLLAGMTPGACYGGWGRWCWPGYGYGGAPASPMVSYAWMPVTGVPTTGGAAVGGTNATGNSTAPGFASPVAPGFAAPVSSTPGVAGYYYPTYSYPTYYTASAPAAPGSYLTGFNPDLPAPPASPTGFFDPASAAQARGHAIFAGLRNVLAGNRGIDFGGLLREGLKLFAQNALNTSPVGNDLLSLIDLVTRVFNERGGQNAGAGNANVNTNPPPSGGSAAGAAAVITVEVPDGQGGWRQVARVKVGQEVPSGQGNQNAAGSTGTPPTGGENRGESSPPPPTQP